MPINANIPITRADFIRKYRKKNANVVHQYAALCTEHQDKQKAMLTFNVKGRGRGSHTKLRICNEIKSRVTNLISDSKSKIYFFSNIEIGSDFSNPHLHVQLWHDDLEAVKAIRKKIIKEFGLVAKRCDLTLPKESEPQRQPKYYDYVIKDYSKDLSDDEVWHLEETKKRMRKQLGTKLRFISKSKGKYTQKLYKMVYFAFGVLRKYADSFIERAKILFAKKIDIHYVLEMKKLFKLSYISSFISIKNKEIVYVMCFIFVVLFACRDPPLRSESSFYYDMYF